MHARGGTIRMRGVPDRRYKSQCVLETGDKWTAHKVVDCPGAFYYSFRHAQSAKRREADCPPRCGNSHDSDAGIECPHCRNRERGRCSKRSFFCLIRDKDRALEPTLSRIEGRGGCYGFEDCCLLMQSLASDSSASGKTGQTGRWRSRRNGKCSPNFPFRARSPQKVAGPETK